MNPIRALLAPRSIAVLGASADFDKLNGRTLKALIDKRYAGPIYPVNPKYPEIAGLKCYPDVDGIPGPVDLAVVAVPAKHVPGAIRSLGAKKVPAAVVFSSGFSEVGGGGVALEADLKAAIRESGVRVLGPNCLGLINSFDSVMASFSQFSLGPTLPGPAAFVTQSGALGTATAGSARKRGLNFGYFVNTGNEVDVTFVEAMREVLADPRIKVGAGYIEGLRDGPGLLALADHALEIGKPLVITKVGRTPAGARAIASHTGSLAGADAIFDAVVRQHGIIRARSDEQLLDFVEVFTKCPLPRGNGIGILTRSGGAGALMADRAEELGLHVVTLSPETDRELKKVVPTFGATGNPVDITAQGLVDPSIMRNSLTILLNDPAVDVACVWMSFTEKLADMNVKLFADVKAVTDKPFIVAWVGAPEHALKALQEAGIATLRGAEPAVDAAAALVRYGDARRRWEAARAEPVGAMPTVALPTSSGVVPTLDAARALQAAGVTLAPAQLAVSGDEAVAIAEKAGYPVVLKIESVDIPHKTEAKGVRLGLEDANAVRAAFSGIIESGRVWRADARIAGVIVQPMVKGDVELVIGLQNDPAFGVVVMAGLGGIHIEVLKDVAFRKAPVSDTEAMGMLDELRARALLEGVRGRPPVDREAVAAMIAAVSRFGAAAGPRLAELDLNPIMAGQGGALAVDWLLVTR